MTPKPMTLDRALDVAINEAFPAHDYFDQGADLKQAAAVLRRFREKGLPFFEAAGEYCRQWERDLRNKTNAAETAKLYGARDTMFQRYRTMKEEP